MPTTMTTRSFWKGGTQFESTGQFGYTLTTDIAIKAGGQEGGFRPTELLFFGVATCTGVDVVRILQKQRQELTGLDIEVTAEQPDEYPKPFQNFVIRYKFRGHNLDRNKLRQAVELSEGKYCSVGQTIRSATTITSCIEFEEEQVAR